MQKTTKKPKAKGRIQRLVMAYGRFRCRKGCHNWGERYHDAGKDWCFGMGHQAQDCTREGCDYVRRHSPS